MTALEILTSARDRFARNRSNWTTGRLFGIRATAEEGQCFCSIGGVLKAGGAIVTKNDGPSLVHADVLAKMLEQDGHYMSPNYLHLYRLGSVFTGTIQDPDDIAKAFSQEIDDAISALEANGVNVKTTVTALKYLQAAAKQVDGPGSNVIALNDSGSDTSSTLYQNVLTMFNVAIKNCKRRHLNGRRLASETARQTA